MTSHPPGAEEQAEAAVLAGRAAQFPGHDISRETARDRIWYGVGSHDLETRPYAVISAILNELCVELRPASSEATPSTGTARQCTGISTKGCSVMEFRKVHGTGNIFRARSAPAYGLQWRRVFPGEERQLGILRRWLDSLLPNCPAQDDVASVATELGANAIRHTASGRGGRFAVEIAWHEAVVRVTVADGGGPTEPHLIDDSAVEHGRGLLLVRGLSLRTGVVGDQQGRLVWAETAWDAPEAAARDLYEGAIRDGKALQARRFGDVPTWFGRSTMTWWELAGPGCSVAARDFRDSYALRV
jgi:hypothetical protein